MSTREVTQPRERTGELDTRMVTMEANYKELSNRYEKLLRKTDDMENRTRRCNLRIWEYLRLEQVLGGGPNGLEKPPVLDRAHRALGPLPPEGGRPRPFIVCAHYYQEKERIQRVAREKVDWNFVESSSSFSRITAPILPGAVRLSSEVKATLGSKKGSATACSTPPGSESP
ncbi:hypothetical protein WMY93_003937 [Mugilogobius chulae]|uniref:Uncharacterized protein n=1 Tax=Mugilogobius chulae TaxID=88201 RepID=A0AAW0QD18_9GOBI